MAFNRQYRHLGTAERRARRWACTGHHLRWRRQRRHCRQGQVRPL